MRGEIMPQCPNCGYQLLGGELHCPACSQPVNFLPPPNDLPQPRALRTLPLGNYIKVGWDLFIQYPYGFIGFCLLNILIQVALHSIPYLGSLVSFAVSPALMMGNFVVAAKLLHRQAPQFRDFFSGFYCFWPLFLVSLVSSILIGIGMVLLIIPGIYLFVGYLFSSGLVLDHRLDFWPAMELSRRTVTPMWFSFFVFMLLLIIINLAGTLLLVLGLLATIPISFCAWTAAYSDLFGFQSDYSQEMPRLKTG
jgi:hypothetical protein